MTEPPPHPQAVAARKARELLAELTALGARLGPGVRVVAAEGRVGCLVVAWDHARGIPPVSAERRAPAGGRRAGCKRDILAVIREAGVPMTLKEVFKALKEAGTPHGRGTVEKALAELTADCVLVNPRDKHGYRMPGWPKRAETPSLF